MDFRNDNIEEIRTDLNDGCTQYFSSSSGINEVPGVVVNDNRRPCGRLAEQERLCRVQGLEIRDRLRQDLVDHNMHRPSLDNEWYYDNLNHTVRG